MSATVSAATASTPTHHHQETPLLLGITSPPSDGQQRERAAGRMRTLLDLLTTEKLDALDPTIRPAGGGGSGSNSSSSRWSILKERLGLKGIGCCAAATWRYGSPPPVHDDDEENEEDQNGVVEAAQVLESRQETAVESIEEEGRVMNLAAALAAERQFRLAEEEEEETTPVRVSLMRLLAESGGEREKEREGEEEGSDRMCCVCMGRKKGAALIPCGHTYCRVCTRELWLNRGSCPLCNRPIVDILDIY